MMELFNFHKKSFIIDEWQGPKYTSDMAAFNTLSANLTKSSNILKHLSA